MSLVETVDLAPFGEHAPLVMFYLKHVDEVNGLDVLLGDKQAKGADFINGLKEQHPDAVEIADNFVKQITAMENEAKRAIVIFMITRNREFSRLASEYIATNQPKEEEQNTDAAEVAALWAKRSNAQKQASIMFQGLKLAEFPEELFNTLPACPEGKKGVAPGQKRGQQGRRLPSPVAWTVITTTDDGVVTEDHGVKTGAQIAKIVDAKSSDIRLAVEKTYPDATPNVFEVTINNKVLKGVVASAVATEDNDDSDDEVTDDLGEIEFDD